MVVIILYTARAPPQQPAVTGVTITTNSVNISWTVARIVFDQETYSLQYGIFEMMMPLDTINKTGNTELSTMNEVFSVYITGLTPFTRYYFIVTATNSFNSSSSGITPFTTKEAGMLL